MTLHYEKISTDSRADYTALRLYSGERQIGLLCQYNGGRSAWFVSRVGAVQSSIDYQLINARLSVLPPYSTADDAIQAIREALKGTPPK